MEVKGIGQAPLPKPSPEPVHTSKFEEVFDESRKQLFGSLRKSDPDSRLTPEVDQLHSPSLDKHPLFVTLKNWMSAFARELQGPADDPEAGEDHRLKVALYGCLLKLLREIVITADRSTQLAYLQRVYDWFLRRNKSRTVPRVAVSAVVSPEGKQSSGQSPLSAAELSGTQLYQKRMRTYHPELKPPKDRLQGFRYKVVAKPRNDEGEEAKTPEAEDKVTSNKETKEPAGDINMARTASTEFYSSPVSPYRSGAAADRVEEMKSEAKEPIPISFQSNFLFYRPKPTSEEHAMERIWFARKNKAVADKRIAEEEAGQVRAWGKAKARVNSDLVRKYENARYASNFERRRFFHSVPKQQAKGRTKEDYKKAYDEPSSESEAGESEIEPTTHALSQHQSATDVSTKYRLRQLRKVKSQAENNKLATSPRKRRTILSLPPQIVDLRQSAANSPSPSPRRLIVLRKSAAVSPDPRTAFADMGKRRVDEVRRLYGHLIGESDDRMDYAAASLVTSSLSPYNRRVKRPQSLVRSTESLRAIPVTHACTRQQYRMQQFGEIERLKKYLAKEGVQHRVKSLERAILIPDDFPASMMVAENFPRPGSRLLVNPFAAPQKRAKKRKA